MMATKVDASPKGTWRRARLKFLGAFAALQVQCTYLERTGSITTKDTTAMIIYNRLSCLVGLQGNSKIGNCQIHPH